ncbi:fumarylacetoacetate hydrolase family protein [Vibrio tapetis subsp. quintayensis]|uniref:fumarylacetoacetate hydrolase family protein n=1 Tax=Vibrio tapetis TaxID=52443 RepID=UPI0025B5CAB3|nr:fumarylacetoacetate hydrolase family protein [Vibrio tapetis]MDN3679216.1 fumarylacetoacetate hydrolase family protein [Vibrio tapetis subsp. quintayensis]
MKLATYDNGTRDGQLMVVSRDLSRCLNVSNLVPTMQALLDEWDKHAFQLQAMYVTMNQACETGNADDYSLFEQTKCLSPLPRAYHWADGSAYVNHVELVRRARGAEIPESFWTDPLMYQGGSDTFLAPRQNIPLADSNWGLDFEAEVAVITKDLHAGASHRQAQESICLMMLVNDVSLRNLIPNELAKGFGFYQSKPSSAFSPVAVTPDELGLAWHGNKVHLPLRSYYNQALFGYPNAGQDMTFDFATLVGHAAKSRGLCTGTIIGSGTVSNKQDTDYGSSIDQGGVGYSCIAELRMIETISAGSPSTAFMKIGDTVAIEMLDENGDSIFGRIEQEVVGADPL